MRFDFCFFGDLQFRKFDFKLFTQFTYKYTAILKLITEWESAKPVLFTLCFSPIQ